MDKGSGLIKLALFGSPVKASLSPRIHKLFAAQFGLEIEFQRIEAQARNFPGKLEEFRLAGGIGCNVTLPLKREAWKLATDSSVQAGLAQAANTLVYQPASGWFAHNSDGAGLVADLTGNHGIELIGQRLLILGAGGAVAGILGSLLEGVPQEIMLVNRNLHRARALVRRFSTLGNVSVASWQDLPAQGSFNLVINATSLGHHGQAPQLQTAQFAPGSLCYDLNYCKASRPLKERCEEMHQPYIDGLGMLVEQAAKSFRTWTGKQPHSRLVIDACKRN
ncbi:MAG: shikimate dehydrogenase [Gammaproteobacteria bacterium]|nr:MAG: shikimate dehydrogenase [Gammaproteobacteria bacterium]